MDTQIPSIDDIRGRLSALTLAQLVELSAKSGVPLPTISKIRYGQTANPGIETVRQFLPHLRSRSDHSANTEGSAPADSDGAPALPAPAEASAEQAGG